MAIKDWPGGVISKTPVVPDGGYLNSAASGVWTLDQVAYWTKQQQWPGTAVGDPYFYDVSLLLTGNGTNGAQNNTFVDSSSNNFTITRNGNTTQGTFSPYGNLWSNYFDGSGDYLTVPNNAAFSYGTGDFTIEFYLYLNATTQQIIWDQRPTAAAPTIYYYNNAIRYYANTADRIIGDTLSVGVWYHIALSRSGTSTKLFVNGNQSGSTYSDSTNYSTSTPIIAADAATGSYNNNVNGYISNLRIVKGTALYTSNFTPSTTPLTAVSGTSLLTCQSNRFIDNSSNNFTLTRNGDVKVQRFSPFNPTAPYSAATIGGSGYFDGTGDYVVAASDVAFAIGSGDYSIECWVYFTGTAQGGGTSGELFGSTTTGAMVMRYKSGTLAVSRAATADDISASVTLTSNQWYHLCATRTGTTGALYVNGTRVATVSSYTASYAQGNFGTINNTQGYMTDGRLVKGSNPYGTGTTLTVPTAPLTAITNTSLLLNFTNAGIPDAAMMNDLETVGNAQISTSVKKYGTGSLAFDGSGDWLQATMPTGFESGNFTIEFWGYNITGVDNWGLFSIGATLGADFAGITMTNGGGLYISTTGTNWTYSNVGSLTFSNDSQWHHYAIVRNGNTLLTFKDGSQQASVSISGSIVNKSGVFLFGRKSDSTYTASGYIDDLRITKGYARYTANFTPPTAAFPTF